MYPGFSPWSLLCRGPHPTCDMRGHLLTATVLFRAVSDDWLGAESTHAISFKGLVLPDRHPPHTELLDLDPLPRSALGCPPFEAMYRFSHFNPIQTQVCGLGLGGVFQSTWSTYFRL